MSSSVGRASASLQTPASGRVSLLDRALTWSSRHPTLVDAATALPWTVLAFMGPPIWVDTERWQDLVWAASCAALFLTLTLRRRRPLAAVAGLLGIGVVHVVTLGTYSFLAVITTAWAGYCIHRRLARRARSVATAVLFTGTAVAALRYSPEVVALPWIERWPVVLIQWMGAGFFCLLGTVARKRDEEADAALERALAEERQRTQEFRLATLDQRTRIAREMHDIVAHSLGVIIAQADGGRYSPDADDARTALSTIAELGRESLGEMRSLVAVLRTDDPRGTGPTPGVDDLEALVDDYRAAGLDVRLRCSGLGEVSGADPEAASAPGDMSVARASLSQPVSLTIYRIVQEALTNVLKHASGEPVAVTVRGLDDVVEVQVWNRLAADNDAGRRADPHTPDGVAGFGITGMRERVAMHHGTLQVGPGAGGWVVLARVPLQVAS